jgi:hypothetical protein
MFPPIPHLERLALGILHLLPGQGNQVLRVSSMKTNLAVVTSISA